MWNKYLTDETTLLPPMIGLVNLFGACWRTSYIAEEWRRPIVIYV
jgi:hypothetical protein